MGLVAQVFDEQKLAALPGRMGVGHTPLLDNRYQPVENAQPVFRQVKGTDVVLAHNGNLTNTVALAEQYGPQFGSADSELMLEAIATAMLQTGGLVDALLQTLPPTRRCLLARDHGPPAAHRCPRPERLRPLSIGRLDDGGWVFASETAALDLVGASHVRDVAPGEVVVVDDGELTSHFPFAETDPSLCVFEFVYFARPDSVLHGQRVMALGWRWAGPWRQNHRRRRTSLCPCQSRESRLPRDSPPPAAFRMRTAWSRTATLAGPSSSRRSYSGSGASG